MEKIPVVNSYLLDAYWQLQALFDCSDYDKDYVNMNAGMNHCKRLQALVHCIDAIEKVRKEGAIETKVLMAKTELVKNLQRELIGYDMKFDDLNDEKVLENVCMKVKERGDKLLSECATAITDAFFDKYTEQFKFIQKYSKGLPDSDFRLGLSSTATWPQFVKHVKDVGLRQSTHVAELDTKLADCTEAARSDLKDQYGVFLISRISFLKQRGLVAARFPTANGQGPLSQQRVFWGFGANTKFTYNQTK